MDLGLDAIWQIHSRGPMRGGVPNHQGKGTLGVEPPAKTCNCFDLGIQKYLRFARWQHRSAILLSVKLLWPLFIVDLSVYGLLPELNDRLIN